MKRRTLVDLLYPASRYSAEDARRHIAARGAMVAILLGAIGSAALFQPWNGDQGERYWRANPAAAAAWLLGSTLVAAAATAAASRIPSREGTWAGRVALLALFALLLLVGIYAGPLL